MNLETTIQNKILGIVEQMKAMETENQYYLKPAWIALQAQKSILEEVLSDERITRAVNLQLLANKQIDILGEAHAIVANELELLVDSFNQIESNAFLRVMKEKRNLV